MSPQTPRRDDCAPFLQIAREGARDMEYDAHWKTAPFAVTRETREVTSADTLVLRLAAGGGQAIRFAAQTP